MKLKVCYLYVESQDTREKIDVCLDNEYDFKWGGKEKQLKVENKRDYIYNFYGGNIMNLNVLIGKNGSLKTTRLNNILSVSDSLFSKGEGIIKVIKVDDEYHVFYPKKGVDSNIDIVDNTIQKAENKFVRHAYEQDKYGCPMGIELDKHDDLYKRVGYSKIYFSNQFGLSNTVGRSSGIDNGISCYDIGIYHLLGGTDNMFFDMSMKATKTSTRNTRNFYTQVYQPYVHMFFLKDNSKGNCEELFQNLQIKMPKTVKIGNWFGTTLRDSLERIGEYFIKNISNKNGDMRPLVKNIKRGLLKLSDTNNCTFYDTLFVLSIEVLLKKYISARLFLHESNTEEYVIKEELFLEIMEWYKNNVELGNGIGEYINRLNKLVNTLRSWAKNKPIDDEEFKLYYLEEIHSAIELFEFINNNNTLIQELDMTLYDKQAYFEFNVENAIIQQFLIKLFNVFPEDMNYFKLEFIDEIGKPIYYSTGEVQLLDIFSRIWYAYCDIKKASTVFKSNEIQNILICLDEPDSYLHPEWQRKLINMFLEYCNSYFGDVNIQVVMATNGPIMASDIPSKDIILCFKEGEENNESPEKTFGKNVYNILREDFFIDNTTGEFAYNKIKELIKSLDSEENLIYTKEEEQTLINMLGEPMLERKLRSMYEKKYTNDLQYLKDKRKKLDEKIEKIERKQNKPIIY